MSFNKKKSFIRAINETTTEQEWRGRNQQQLPIYALIDHVIYTPYEAHIP
jgi:hypothetical protein